MYDAQNMITLGLRVDDDTERNHVVKILKYTVAALEFAIDRVDMFDAAFELEAGETLCQKRIIQNALDAFDVIVFVLHQGINFCVQISIFLGMQVFEADVLEFGLHPLDAQAVGDWHIDVERFLGDAGLFVGPHVLKRAHIVHAVCQFD